MLAGLARVIRGELAQLKLLQMWHLVAGAVVAVAALFGGLDSVDAKPKVFNVGQPYSDGEFTVTVERATALDDVRAGARVIMPAEPGHIYLGLVSTIRNDGPIQGSLSTGLKHAEFDLQQPRNEFLGAFRIADASMVVLLAPKLSEKVVFLWKVPRSEVAAGSSVTLRVWQKQLREMVVTYGKDWLASETSYAQIVVPVVKR
ncbi:MAG TPA: hypothetical protein VGG53_14180 [Mycobacterium sp.]|uniref:hypothetical protein n=1 Tax=Mycobacterium sp. TaxID=1785 RepID=UPI002F41F395